MIIYEINKNKKIIAGKFYTLVKFDLSLTLIY